MAQTFISLPAGSPGASAAVPVSEDLKTFYAGGTYEAEQVALEVSADGTNFTVAGAIPVDAHEPIPVVFSAAHARVNVIGLRSGSPVCVLAVNTITGTQSAASLPVPASPGVGSSVAVNTLPRVKSFFVAAAGDAVACEAVVEVSLDGTNFNPLFLIEGRLFRQGDVVVKEGFWQSARVRLTRGTGTGLVVGIVADPTCC